MLCNGSHQRYSCTALSLLFCICTLPPFFRPQLSRRFPPQYFDAAEMESPSVSSLELELSPRRSGQPPVPFCGEPVFNHEDVSDINGTTDRGSSPFASVQNSPRKSQAQAQAQAQAQSQVQAQAEGEGKMAEVMAEVAGLGLSICGDALAKAKVEGAATGASPADEADAATALALRRHEIFEEHRVEAGRFNADAAAILADPQLMVRLPDGEPQDDLCCFLLLENHGPP